MKTICAALYIGLLTIPSLFVAAQQPPKQDLASLYRNIIDRSENGHPPRLEEVAGYFDNVTGMDVKEIQSALPWIQKAIESPSEEARTYGLLGLYAIDERQDSASLIGYLVPVISKKLDDPYSCTMAIQTLSDMKPKPPEEAISLILHALQSGLKLHLDAKLRSLQIRPIDEVEDLGPGLVFALVQIDPNRDDFVRAIHDYMTTRMITTYEKVGTLNALGAHQVRDKRLIADVAAHLTDQSDDVRISAIHAIERSGSTGIEANRPQLQRLAGSGEASDRVRAAAKRALGNP